MHAPRSHTDALTNLVVLSALDIRRNFQEILDRDLPIPTLPTFLHEATHHWCFDTPVGLALHLLFMRARRSAIGAGAGKDTWQTFDHVVRYELARDFIQPLSEGMALFAEHDAVPGAAKTISTPMSQASALYARGYAFDAKEPYAGLPLVLAAARISRHHLRRKAALLLEPLSCAKGGYLPGYMLIKALWPNAWAASTLFHDSDFLLQYLRSYLFDDWVLVARLLDEDRSDLGALEPILTRVADRIQTFVNTAIRGDRPRRFESLVEGGDHGVLKIRTRLLATDIRFVEFEHEDEAELGRSLLERGFSRHFARWTGDERTDAFLSGDLVQLSQRTLLPLGSASAHGRSTADGLELSIDGRRLATVRRDHFEALPEIDGIVHLDLVSLDTVGLCLTLKYENRFLSSIPIGARDLPEQLKAVLATREERAEETALSYSFIAEALAKADLEEHLEVMRNMVQRYLDRWLIPRALNNVPDDRLEDVRARMRENGFLDIFGGDVKLLVDAAAASLTIPSPYTFASVESFHQWAEPTPLESIARIAEIVWKELGLPPFLLDENDHFEKVSFI